MTQYNFTIDYGLTLQDANITATTANNSAAINFVGNSSGDGAGYTTMQLVPDETLTGNDQYVILDPTAPGHIHIRAGGQQDNSSADLFLGGENSHVKIAAGANSDVVVRSNSNNWTFDTLGVLTLPGEGVLRSIGDSVTLQSYNVGTGNVNSVYLSSGGGLGFLDQDIGGNWLEIFRSGAEPQIRVPVGRGNLNVQTAEGINAYDWVFDNTGNLIAPGNITTTANVAAAYFIGDGSQLTGLSVSYGNANVADFLANGFGSNTISTTGNITGNTAGFTIGYRDIPQVTFSANATAALADAGKHYYSTTAGNLQITLPDNNSVAFPTGAALTIVVNAAGNVVVGQGTGVSLYQAGSSATGNRVVGAYGLATVMKVAANTWVISGTGVY